MIIEQVFVEKLAVWNSTIQLLEIKYVNATLVVDVCIVYDSVSTCEITNLNIHSSYEIPKSQYVIHRINVAESYICEEI